MWAIASRGKYEAVSCTKCRNKAGCPWTNCQMGIEFDFSTATASGFGFSKDESLTGLVMSAPLVSSVSTNFRSWARGMKVERIFSQILQIDISWALRDQEMCSWTGYTKVSYDSMVQLGSDLYTVPIRSIRQSQVTGPENVENFWVVTGYKGQNWPKLQLWPGLAPKNFPKKEICQNQNFDNHVTGHKPCRIDRNGTVSYCIWLEKSGAGRLLRRHRGYTVDYV